jgi:tetratricopeptide (TPR) repeat protein
MMDSQEERAEEAEERGDLEPALQIWKDIAIGQQDPRFFARYGLIAQELERWEEAESAFNDALRLDPSFVPAIEGMGNLWATRTDKDEILSFEAARNWFLKALEQGRNARLLTFLGAAYLALENTAAARDAFEEAIGIDPEYEEALYNLAKLYKETNPQRSLKLLEKAIEIDPRYSLAHQELGKLCQHAGDLPRAEHHFRQSLEADPADYWSHMYLANVLAVEGRSVEAEQTYRFATSLHPELASGTEIFARFLESIGKKNDAAEVRAKIKL